MSVIRPPSSCLELFTQAGQTAPASVDNYHVNFSVYLPLVEPVPPL